MSSLARQVSEFATPRQQKILSYFSGTHPHLRRRGLRLIFVGWLTAIGWQTYLASVCFLVGTIIQGLIILNDPTYVPRPWHGTLLAIAVVAFSIAFNTILAAQLPTIGKWTLTAIMFVQAQCLQRAAF